MSIDNAGTPTHSVWKQCAGRVGNANYSLNEVEDLLRQPKINISEDARIHFAIVCASISCPNLRNETYRPEKLNAQLNDNMRDLLSNPAKGMKLDTQANTLLLSKLFDWYHEDFAPKPNGTIIGFILKYNVLPAAQAEYLKAHPNISISYMTYDWDLNGYLEDACTLRTCYPFWAFISNIIVGVLVLILAAVLVSFRIRRHNKPGYISVSYE
jgi:hypothetical protein